MLSVNQIEDIKEQAFMGVPSQFEAIGKVYPFTIDEIIRMSSSTYNSYLGLLLLTEVDIVNIIKEKTGEEIPIEQVEVLSYLLQSATANDTFLLELQTAFSTFLKEEILLLPKINSVLVGPPDEKRLITKDNFPIFQDILRIQNKREVKEAPPVDETPGQRKMRLLREKVAEVKKKQAQKNNGKQTFVELLEIASTYGIDVGSHSLYAFYSLLSRYQRKEKWEQDLQMICAGADSSKLKTKYWGESTSE